jgi:hypothetical protein
LRACALDGEGEIAAAGGEIKDSGGIPRGDDGRGAAAPEKVEAAGKEVIGEVVPASDRRKKRVDELGLLQGRQPTCAAR